MHGDGSRADSPTLPRAFKPGGARSGVHPETVLHEDVPRSGRGDRAAPPRIRRRCAVGVVARTNPPPTPKRSLHRAIRHEALPAHPTARAVCESTCGWAVNATPPSPSARSGRGGARRGEHPGGNFPSRSSSPAASSVTGSSATGRPASYSAYTRSPHARMLVLARFFWCRSRAFAANPPGACAEGASVAAVSAASSTRNSVVRTNRDVKAHADEEGAEGRGRLGWLSPKANGGPCRRRRACACTRRLRARRARVPRGRARPRG